MYDIIIIFLFWAMVIAPCMVAMNVGVDRYAEDEWEDYVADGSEFEAPSLSSRRCAPRLSADSHDEDAD